jgi:hypothetical protein
MDGGVVNATAYSWSAHELRAQAWVAERFSMGGSAKYVHRWLTRVSINARAAAEATVRTQLRSPIDNPRAQAHANLLRHYALQAEQLCQALQRGSRHVSDCEKQLESARSAVGRAAAPRPWWLRWLPQRRSVAAKRLAVAARSQALTQAVQRLQLVVDRAAQLLHRPTVRPYWELQGWSNTVPHIARPQATQSAGAHAVMPALPSVPSLRWAESVP